MICGLWWTVPSMRRTIVVLRHRQPLLWMLARNEGVEGRWREQKASFFAGSEELQGFLEVLDGCAHVFVLQGAAGVLTELLSLTEVLQGEMDAAWTGSEREEERSVMEVEMQKVWRQKWFQSKVWMNLLNWKKYLSISKFGCLHLKSVDFWSGGGASFSPLFILWRKCFAVF